MCTCCKNIVKEIKYIGGYTSYFHTHLKTLHGFNLECESLDDVESSVSIQPELILNNYFKNNKKRKNLRSVCSSDSMQRLVF